jgi:acetyltransferase-like isoleucine patch superfamily enzyme
MTKRIDKTARIGKKVTLGEDVIIGKNAVIGDEVSIGHRTIIHEGTVIGKGTVVGENSVLGKTPIIAKTSTLKPKSLPVLRVGEGCVIAAGAIIFRGVGISNDCLIGDLSLIREECSIGKKTIIGKGVTIENKTSIGSYAKIQANAYITAYTEIGDYVFIGPCAVTANDNFMGRTKERFKYRKGPVIHKGARVGACSIILPGVTIGKEGFIAAGSVVTRDVPEYKLVMGSPARVIRDVPDKERLP